MQTCKNCQEQLADNDKFCPNCGSTQNQTPKTNNVCQKCNHENLFSAAFCENCGISLADEQTTKLPPQNEANKIVSKGNYSGIMTKGNSKFGKRLWYIVIITVTVIAIALIIWFQLDPNAGKKLSNFLFGLGFIAVFVFFIFRAAKKGKYKGRRMKGRRGFSFGSRNYNSDEYFDRDDYNDNDDDYDDGGDDD